MLVTPRRRSRSAGETVSKEKTPFPWRIPVVTPNVSRREHGEEYGLRASRGDGRLGGRHCWQPRARPASAIAEPERLGLTAVRWWPLRGAPYRGSRAQKRRSSTTTNAAASTTTVKATTIPAMNGSAVSAEPIKTATPTRKTIPSTMKAAHARSRRVMIGGRSTTREFDQHPAGLLPLGERLHLPARSPIGI
jgi:hypothetical protein